MGGVLRLLLTLVFVGARCGCASAAAAPRAIVLMLGDDYGYGNVGFAHGPNPGNPESRTPHMDSLARGGVILDRHYVYKYCSPTRSSLMSGRLPPHVNQNNRNNNIEATSGVDLRFTMLSQKMKLAGYSTHFVGKSHLGARSPANLPINRGCVLVCMWRRLLERNAADTAAVRAGSILTLVSSKGAKITTRKDRAAVSSRGPLSTCGRTMALRTGVVYTPAITMHRGRWRLFPRQFRASSCSCISRGTTHTPHWSAQKSGCIPHWGFTAEWITTTSLSA